MKKKLLVFLLAALAAIVCALALTACAGESGTYYKLGYDGKPDSKTYFTLKSGKWTDEDGESGTYKKDGDKIVFYYTFFGETEELCDGTIKDGVLKVNGDTYISEKHKHSYGEWETTREADCTVDGIQTHTCACGVKETRAIVSVGHNLGGINYDEFSHWYICTKCNEKVEENRHAGIINCSICNSLIYAFDLEYELNETQDGYIVVGIGTEKHNILRIPSTYNGLPVIEIGEDALSNYNDYDREIIENPIGNIVWSNGLIIIIPDSMQTINSCAFEDDGSTIYVIIGKGVTFIGDYAFCNCRAEYFLYNGSIEDWGNISKGNIFGPYSGLASHIFYYSETEPTESGNYWHYDNDGITPVIWTK